jgi:hypothetical protein
MARKSKTETGSAPVSAAERLAGVHAEIAELSKPMPPHAADVDLDDLTNRLVDREHRKHALGLIIPALERAAIEERLPDIMQRKSEADAECARLDAIAVVAKAKFEAANVEWTQANEASIAAFWRVNFIAGELQQLGEDLRVHDERHDPPAPVHSHLTFDPRRLPAYMTEPVN